MVGEFETIRYEVADGIATITYCRPDKLNAFTGAMIQEIVQTFDRIDADDAVRAVVVTGDGRGFCAGADLSAGADTFKSFSGEESLERADGSLDYSRPAARDLGGFLSLRIHRCLKPVIAAINGPAAGIGVTSTLPMDVRLASDRARFAMVFSRRGIVPEAASSYFLPRVVGISQALEWCYSGKPFDAEAACAGGLVKAVYPHDELLPAAYALAHEFIDGTAPVSLALIRQMLWRGIDMNHPMDAHRLDSRGVLWRARSADAVEGVNSFLEKRPGRFSDRVSTDMPDFFPWWEEPEYH